MGFDVVDVGGLGGVDGREGGLLRVRHRTTSPVGAEVEHPGHRGGGVVVFEVEQVGRQRDHVAAASVGGEVGPHAGLHVDLERAQVLVAALGVARDILVVFATAVG